MRAFERTIGIDYSGAETPTSSLKGLRVYLCEGDAAPIEVLPPSSPRKYWTRRGIAEWLAERLAEDAPTLVGIDHGFSFPLRYFEAHGLLPDWSAFLDDFQRHWPTDEDYTYVDFVRNGTAGHGALRQGDRKWRRLTELRAGGAKSVFHFDVQGSVAKARSEKVWCQGKIQMGWVLDPGRRQRPLLRSASSVPRSHGPFGCGARAPASSGR
jgi:hypothetical protein